MSAFGDALSIAIQRRPALLQLVSGLARRISPVWVVGRSVIALGSDAVREVFDRANDFELGPIGHRKMLLGRFLLGMDPRQQYVNERKLLGEVLESLERQLAAIAREEAERARDAIAERIAAHRAGSAPIEVVSEFAEPVVMRIASRFYGVPFPGRARSGVVVARSGEDLLAAWLRKAGSVIASTAPAPFGLQRVAEGCAIELAAYLDAVIDQRRAAAQATGTDVLSGLLELVSRQQLDAARVRANLAGLMLAGSTALVKSFVLALRQLLVQQPQRREDPPWRDRAIEAARDASDGNAARAREGERRLRALLFEALRFDPTFPVLVRYCPRATTLGEGERARSVPAGSTVFAVPLAAMFDDLVEDADTFSPLRPTEHYLHFGAGPHECLGRHVAATELGEMLRAFLTLPHLDRVGPAQIGRIRYDGPAVHRFRIRVPGAAS